MKINQQNIYGGNQQFADSIINSGNNNISDSDRKLLDLIFNNTENIEQRELLISSLSNLKNSSKSEEVKVESTSILRRFISSIPGEIGKQIIKHLIDNGADYLQTILK